MVVNGNKWTIISKCFHLDRSTSIGHSSQMGPLSWVLLLLALNGLLMTGLLVAAPGNGLANYFLGALSGLISLRLLIYVLGFAGAYDDHPWITFAPLDASWAFGPLLWLYVVTLTRGIPPPRWKLHMVPAAVQLAYSTVAFSFPLPQKLDWFRGPHLEIVAPAGLYVLLISCSAYLVAAWFRQLNYQRWLDQRFSNRERWRLGWIKTILTAFAATLLIAVTAAVIDAAVTPLDYFARTPVIIVSALLAYALGLLGWRNSTLNLPAQPAIEAVDPGYTRQLRSRPAAAFADWAQKVEAEGWWREESLTLSNVAKRLGTSDRTLSRGLSEGGGSNFNDFINGMRVRAVTTALSDGAKADMLTLALDNGFSSKASFNRAFRRHTGTTPSAWRTSAAQNPPNTLAGAN